MTLAKWDPFETLGDLQEDINTIFNRRFLRPTAALQKQAWMPAVDIHEDAESLVFNIDAPGISKENLHINVENNVLTLKGERSNQTENKGKNFHRVEREYGSFVRSFALPQTADTERVAAEYKDGVLNVRIPKKETAKPKKIDVKVA